MVPQEGSSSTKTGTFDVIFVAGQPAGRLFVARKEEEFRIIDIARLPEYCNRGIARRWCGHCNRKPRLRS